MLHPQARFLLDLMVERQVPPTHTLSPAEARRLYRERRAVTQPEPPPIAETRDLQASAGSAARYSQSFSVTPTPIVVCFQL